MPPFTDLADPIYWQTYFARNYAPVNEAIDENLKLRQAKELQNQRFQHETMLADQRDKRIRELQDAAHQNALDLEGKRELSALTLEKARQAAEDLRQKNLFIQQVGLHAATTVAQQKMEMAREKHQLDLKKQENEFKDRETLNKNALAMKVNPKDENGHDRPYVDVQHDIDTALASRATAIRQQLDALDQRNANLHIEDPNQAAIQALALKNVAQNSVLLGQLKDKDRAALVAASGSGDYASFYKVASGFFGGKTEDLKLVETALNSEIAKLDKAAGINAQFSAANQRDEILKGIKPLTEQYARLLGQMSPAAAADFETSWHADQAAANAVKSQAAPAAKSALDAAKAGLPGGAPTVGPYNPATYGPQAAPVSAPAAAPGAQSFLNAGLGMAALGDQGLGATPPAAPSLPFGPQPQQVMQPPLALNFNASPLKLGSLAPPPFAPSPTQGPSNDAIAARTGIPAADLNAMEQLAIQHGSLTPAKIQNFQERVAQGDQGAINELRGYYTEYLKGKAEHLFGTPVQQQPTYAPSTLGGLVNDISQ